MRHAGLLLLLIVLPCTAFAGPAFEIDIELPDNKKPGRAFTAVCQAVAASGTVLSEEPAGPGLIASGGCYIWQQPGAGLVVTGVWQTGSAPELWYSPKKFHGFLKALPAWKFEEPFLHPPEPENSDEFYLEPQVYLLKGKQATDRLGRYMAGYEAWLGYMGNGEMIVPEADDLLCDFAVVYIDSGGPLGFYFVENGEGELLLRHLILWDFFSA